MFEFNFLYCKELAREKKNGSVHLFWVTKHADNTDYTFKSASSSPISNAVKVGETNLVKFAFVSAVKLIEKKKCNDQQCSQIKH